MDDAVEDRVGVGWIADGGVPALHRELAGQDDGAAIVPVVDDLHEVPALGGGQVDHGGFRHDADYRKARLLLDTLELRALGGRQVALAAADNYRMLRRLGVTPRKTIDMIIAAYCLVHALELLHCDRDFDVLETELGLLIRRA